MRNLLLFNLKTDTDDDVLGFTTSWINALARRYDRVFVITMHAGRIEVAGNVMVASVGGEKGYPGWLRLLVFYRHLASVLLRHRFAGCFAHMAPLFLVLASPLLRLRGIPAVLWYTHKHADAVLRLAYRLCYRAVTASRESFPLPGDKVRVIGHGIDVHRFRPSLPRREDGAPFRILTVGRISPVKKLEVALRAVAEAGGRPGGIALMLDIVGGAHGSADEEYLARLKTLVSALGLEGCVAFRGSLPFGEVPSAYASADCFINTCETGGVDKAVLEAMSCGLPVVTSNASFRTVLGPDLAGEWVADSGDVGALAGMLVRAARMAPADARALGGSLREIVCRGFSLEGIAGRIAGGFPSAAVPAEAKAEERMAV